jgi:hypothetical protein
MAIEEAAADGMARNQADPVFISHHPKLRPMQQLQPGQTRHDGATAEQHQGHEPGTLLGQARAAGTTRKNKRGHGIA